MRHEHQHGEPPERCRRPGGDTTACTASATWALWGSYIALGFFVVIFLVPPFYTLMTSFKSSAEISAQSGNPWFPHHPTLENFWYLITYPNFQTYYLNSVIITVLVVAISITISVLAAFSLARMGFWGSQALATGVFLTYLIPASLLFLPLFQIVGWLGLINSFWCLVLLYPTLGGAVLHLDHDRLLQLDPKGTG